jgi:hypothetical protein
VGDRKYFEISPQLIQIETKLFTQELQLSEVFLTEKFAYDARSIGHDVFKGVLF